MHMPAPYALMLAEQQAALIADVHEIMRERTPTRNVLIAALVDEIVTMLQTFTGAASSRSSTSGVSSIRSPTRRSR